MAAVQQMFGTKRIFIFSQKHVSRQRMLRAFAAAILIRPHRFGVGKKKTKRKDAADRDTDVTLSLINNDHNDPLQLV